MNNNLENNICLVDTAVFEKEEPIEHMGENDKSNCIFVLQRH